jgi:hypothetical protein
LACRFGYAGRKTSSSRNFAPARPRDLEDVQAVLARQSDELDGEYLKRRAAELGLAGLLEEQRKLALVTERAPGKP